MSLHMLYYCFIVSHPNILCGSCNYNNVYVLLLPHSPFPSIQWHVCDSDFGNTYHICENINGVFYTVV